ncbi:PREDICTED: inositol polyphosphate 5-phosphatase OCRL-1-like [Acropora digitifera]|uniref:inositol polyphosphate 5-phosphatase OCRL-1-like n=1 Tax=Acropora digitifera TaxID=70779 RepID=UPI00077A1269|nr:PREDICTED: inositol polyphosphate 5-phosphatase OCRL-1-like [Acropora digitifera]
MPGFSPSPIHPSVSVGSLVGLDDTDAAGTSSPALPRRSLPSTSIGARDGFIRFNMDQRENEFTSTKHMKIFVGTWNVNEQVPTKEVSSWLSVDDEPPDIFVLGLQEVDLTADSFLKKDLPREEAWLKIMEKGLHPKGQYEKVKSIRLVGILLMVFIENKHLSFVKDVYAESVATGIMGLMVWIIVWLGDLNYRIGGMDNTEVRMLADRGKYEPLLVKDQLTQQRNHKKCFEGFHEGSITFKPTYRYDPGTDVWDTSEKNRIPAWCDRILWRTGSKMEIKLMKYRSHKSINLSDHKPVSALFDVGVRVVNVTEERRILEDVIRKLDRQENENLPQVQLGSTEFNLRQVSVSGNYLPSVFGSSIEALVRMYGPIREVPVATLVDLEHMNTFTDSGLSKTEPLEVPKELWLLTDHLFKFGMKEDNILRQSGLEGELEKIRTHLDCCKGGKLPGSIHAVAEALLVFLEALPEPVIPYAFYQRALECCNNYILCKQLISQIPQTHKNVFTYVSSFLRELLLYSNDNKLDAKTLATLIGTLFLRAPKNNEAGLSKRTQNQQTQKKARFMYHFLINDFGPTR